MAQEQLEYLTLADFRAGIYSRYSSSSLLGVTGAAQIHNGDPNNREYTYGCYGDPAGGLHPLPRKIRSYTRDATTGESEAPIDGRHGVMDALVVSPVTHGDTYVLNPMTNVRKPWLDERYPEGLIHPDTIHLITSHRGIPQPGTGEFPRGRPIAKWRVFYLHRYEGNPDLHSLEQVWQYRYAHRDEGIHFTAPGYSGYTWTTYWYWSWRSAPSGGWCAGSLAYGKSIPSIPDGNTVTLEELGEPGVPVVLGSAVLNTPYQVTDGTHGFLPNFFTMWGGPSLNRPNDNHPDNTETFTWPKVPSTEYMFNSFTREGVPSYIVAHQDRFVCKIADGMGVSYNNDGAGAGYHFPLDRWRYTELNCVLTTRRRSTTGPAGNIPDSAVNPVQSYSIYKVDTYNDVKGAENQPFGPPYDVYGNDGQGVGAAISYNSSLVIFKRSGGAALVQGSLEDPTVISLPGVPSVGIATHHPVVTPIGVVYGTQDGVFLWAGESTAEHLSPQLDGWFWDCGPESETAIDSARNLEGSRGRFAFRYPFVFVPNNWVYDIRTKGWFRLTDPAEENPYPYMHYGVSVTGDVYAIRGVYTSEWNNVIELYSDKRRATTYRWVSQPLESSPSREVEVVELILVAQGRGEVMVKLSGLGEGNQETTFTVDSPDRPQRIVRPVKVTAASDLVVTISAVGDGTGEDQLDAPTVHQLHLGSRPGKQNPRS